MCKHTIILRLLLRLALHHLALVYLAWVHQVPLHTGTSPSGTGSTATVPQLLHHLELLDLARFQQPFFLLSFFHLNLDHPPLSHNRSHPFLVSQVQFPNQPPPFLLFQFLSPNYQKSMISITS
ncbi:BTE_collapsed_G0044470.mRNA.1.CDS.1 [Saccharomyces cerevisiae]|nr:BTE_collapsed_G0044470.mRNA.1.CDS.1 [Saccharomyces cerevisiae]